MKKLIPFIVFVVLSHLLFAQDNSSVSFVWSSDDISTFDTLGYLGEEVMLQTEIILIDKIKKNDTTYTKVSSIDGYNINITVKEKKTCYINTPKQKFTVFHFKYDKTYEIVYEANGYYSKKILLDTHNSGKHQFGYLFPCEVRLYKKKLRNKKYIQKQIPLIKYDPLTDYYQFTLIEAK